MITRIARTLADDIPDHATLARLGGDEFVIVLEALESIDDAVGVAGKCVSAVQRAAASYDVPGATVGASIGIAYFPQHAADPDELIRRADVAMYDAKAAGRNCWRISRAADDERFARASA